MQINLHRRSALQLLASSVALLPMAAYAQGPAPAGRILILSDLHSAYERSAQLLAALEAEVAIHDVPHLIVINGDVFEIGNAVTKRSGGAMDWAFLQALARLAPTVLNLGNHEPDLVEDLSEAIARAQAAGLTVVSNIGDARTGQPFVGATAALRLGDMPVKLVGIATDAITTYPKAQRESLAIPAPVDWAAAHLGDALAGPGLNIVLSHAGVVADRAILPMLPDGTLLIGGHDHLLFTHVQGATRYVHTGSWSSTYTVADIGADGAIGLTQVPVDPAGPASADLAALIATTMAEHLTDAERATVATAPAALTLAETGRFVAAAMAQAAGADVGFIGHTTLGTGLPAGAVSLHAFNSVVRFDGKLVVAEVDAATLSEILAICNQDQAATLDQRTGDFLYAAPSELPQKATYRIVTGDWPAMNQKKYFLREDLSFAPGPEVTIKPLVVAAIGKG